MAGPDSDRLDVFGLVGRTLEGQYRVDQVIGEGGFSIVYRGRHVGLDEPIAIKCLKLDAGLGAALIESFVHRFRDEGRILYRLSQGNLHVVRCIASGTTVASKTGALVPYTVLEWLEGRSLAEELEDRRGRGARGRLVSETVALLDTAVDAVAYAHAQGVVHRDLNPGNIFLASTRDGVRAKVLDFGIAKVVSDHALALGPRLATMGNIRMFAPAYAAPEQLDESFGKVGPWTDVYTLAVVFLEVLRDQMTFVGETLAELVSDSLKAEGRPTPALVGRPLGEGMESLFRSALALSPAARPRDAGEFWGALKNATMHIEGTRADLVPQRPLERTLPLPRPAAGQAPDLSKTLIERGPPPSMERRGGLPTTTLRMSRNIAEEAVRSLRPEPSRSGTEPLPRVDDMRSSVDTAPLYTREVPPDDASERTLAERAALLASDDKIDGARRLNQGGILVGQASDRPEERAISKRPSLIPFYLLGVGLAVVVVLAYALFAR